jgi:HK97 gp10 family phage protein
VTLKSAIPALRRAIPDALDDTVRETAQIVKDTRDPLTPVDTGDLLDSGRIVRHDTAHYEVREGDGLPDARARYTEFGTSRQAAQPHMTPAAAEGRRQLPQRGRANLRRVIKGAT